MEEDMDEGQNTKGCLECCIKCLGGIPYPSLVATILLYAGVALFCGCGHEALSGTVTILQNYFEVVRSPVDALDVFTMIDIIKYVIYGIASAFFVYGILLMVEGFFTSGAIKDLYGDFKITTCGRCVSAWFIMLTYIFMLAWLGVTAFTSIPVFLYFNIWNICQNATVLDGTDLCLDPRQYAGHDVPPLYLRSGWSWSCCHRHDPLPDGAVCQLGLREGRLPDAEVRGHQVEGGAGAPRHPLHALQGAPQRLHIDGSVRPGPASLPPLSPCFLSSLPSPPEGRADGA
uniref:Proteolipid protein DM beta n=1 Tax=Oryzias latipes TaxID=8090 RepID=A0A3P9KGT1_ORYLA